MCYTSTRNMTFDSAKRVEGSKAILLCTLAEEGEPRNEAKSGSRLTNQTILIVIRVSSTGGDRGEASPLAI